MAQLVLDTTDGDRKWAQWRREWDREAVKHLREVYPDAPDDPAVAKAFSTSRTDRTAYDPEVARMTDEGLRWALAHENVQAGLRTLRREARLRGWPLPRAQRNRAR